MALWKNSVKKNGNAACKSKRQHLEKGMFVETSTETTMPPISLTREQPFCQQRQNTNNNTTFALWITLWKSREITFS